MNTIEILVTIFGALGGIETVKWLMNRKSNKALAAAQADLAAAQADMEEWHLYKEQLQQDQQTIDTLNKRVAELLAMNKEKEDRFVDQTKRLRETQAREMDANEALIRAKSELAEANAKLATAEKRIGELNLRLLNHECIKLRCTDREPENEHSKRAKAEAAKKKSAEARSGNKQ